MAGPGVKAATGAETVKQPPPGSSEVLNQTGKSRIFSPRMAMVGVAVVATFGFLALYTSKKPEASALDVAKVTAGVSHPDNTHPRN